MGPDRGPAAIVRLASSRPGEITLVCVGPLTNLAIALNVEPRLPDLLSRVVVMGGAYDIPGNVTPTAEFNIYADPEAAAQVFEAPFRRITIVGLDVTHRTPWPRTAWEAAVQAARADPAARLAVAVCRQAFVERSLAQVYLHDPLAVAVALDPTLVNQENTSIVVGLGDEDRGVTRAIGPGTVGVAKAVDVRRFLSRFASALHLPDWSSLGSSWELGPGVAKTTAAAPRRPLDR